MPTAGIKRDSVWEIIHIQAYWECRSMPWSRSRRVQFKEGQSKRRKTVRFNEIFSGRGMTREALKKKTYSEWASSLPLFIIAVEFTTLKSLLLTNRQPNIHFYILLPSITDPLPSSPRTSASVYPSTTPHGGRYLGGLEEKTGFLMTLHPHGFSEWGALLENFPWSIFTYSLRLNHLIRFLFLRVKIFCSL